MKKKLALVLGLAALLASCVSTQKNPENIAFQKEMEIDFGFLLRGVWAQSETYKDKGYMTFWNKMLKNIVTFDMDEQQPEFMKCQAEGEGFRITINGTLNQFSPEGKHALITSGVYVIGLLQTSKIDRGVMQKRFYEVIAAYAEQFVMDDLINDERYKNHLFQVADNGINLSTTQI
jgi:hypothetical protein